VSIHRLPKIKLTIVVDVGTIGELLYHPFVKEHDGFQVIFIFRNFVIKCQMIIFQGLNQDDQPEGLPTRHPRHVLSRLQEEGRRALVHLLEDLQVRRHR